MSTEIDVQRVTGFKPLPAYSELVLWAETALQGKDGVELAIRLVDRDESRALNQKYRGQDKPTNVLSFPADLPPGLGLSLLGDIVVCAPLAGEEAEAQGKCPQSHWAHLVIHGVLHLLGHDHQDEREAQEMETLETELMASLGFQNPYA